MESTSSMRTSNSLNRRIDDFLVDADDAVDESAQDVGKHMSSWVV